MIKHCSNEGSHPSQEQQGLMSYIYLQAFSGGVNSSFLKSSPQWIGWGRYRGKSVKFFSRTTGPLLVILIVKFLQFVAPGGWMGPQKGIKVLHGNALQKVFKNYEQLSHN